MATKIKDQATAQRAALKLNEGIEAPATGEPNAPREKGTTERLFPAFMTDDGAIVNRPVRNSAEDVSPIVLAPETPKADLQGQTPQTQTPTAPSYLSESELKGKMAKIKVDGIEQDVPAEELFKLTQLERHSNSKLMKLAQERAEFERERASFLAQRTVPQDPVKPTKQDPQPKKSDEVQALEARLSQMEGFIAQQQETLRPAIQEAGISRVEKLAKERLGADDFRSYFDKVKEIAVSKAQDAQMKGDPNWRQFDSDGFYFETYKEMKIKDLLSKPATSTVNPNAPVLRTQEGAPIVMTNSGQPVSLPVFEGSSGVPSRQSPDANWQGTYNALFTRAQKSGSESDWAALYRHKMSSRE